VDFALSDEQREIQEGAKRLMAELAPLDRVVEVSAGELGYDPDAYRQIAELGWTGMHVPEQHGGVGLGHVELVVVLEQIGAVLHPSPFFASVCLAVNALIEGAAAGPLSGENAALLAAIAAGERTATLASPPPDVSGRPSRGGIDARLDGTDWILRGSLDHVLDGHTADAIVTAAARSDTGRDLLVVVPADAPGLTRTRVHAIDPTRRLARLDFADVRVPSSAALGDPDDAAPTLSATIRLASVALAAESLGAAQHCFDTALAYTKDRFQFGRPIASFQAVKHLCADLLMGVEGSRSAVYYAGWAATEQPAELPVVAPLAKAHVCEAFWETAKANIQLHGGIGFTFEHEAHYYYRRATSSRVLLGDTATNRELLVRALERTRC
jgi:alkylation response protein AidB-like acyl-CoA dehydrogenase